MTLRVAIAGVGNCANALVQGVTFYSPVEDDATVPGLMHTRFGPYRIRDIEFVAAFDVDAEKVGTDLAEAIWASQNDTFRFAEVAPTGVTVQRGPTLDGLGEYYREVVTESPAPVGGCGRGASRIRCAGARLLPARRRGGCRPLLRAGGTGCGGRVRQRSAGLHRERSGLGGEVPRGGHSDRRRRHQEPARRDHHAPRARATVRGARAGARSHLPAERRRQHGLQEHARALAPAVEEDLEDPVGHEQPRRRRSTPTTCTSARAITCPGCRTARSRSCGSRATASATRRPVSSTSSRSGTRPTAPAS